MANDELSNVRSSEEAPCSNSETSNLVDPDENIDSKNVGHDENLSKLSAFYEKYSKQFAEVERLEEENREYKEKLVKAIRERDSNGELLKNCRSEVAGKIDELERKILEYSYQLKASKDRAEAQELHQKKFINQLTRKLETAEKEKNDAVIRYATREAELMKMTAEKTTYMKEFEALRAERDGLLQSTECHNIERLNMQVEELLGELQREKSSKTEIENCLKMAEKRIEANLTAISELKNRLELSQRELTMETENKVNLCEESKKLIQQIHDSEQHNNNSQELYKSVIDELIRLRERNHALVSELESVTKENVGLLSECEKCSSELKSLQKSNAELLYKLPSLESMQIQVKESALQVELAQKCLREANEDREQAEREASVCRHQAERMLEITEKLTGRNSTLSSDCEGLRAKNLSAQTKIVELESEIRKLRSRLQDFEVNLDVEKASSSSQINSLKTELNENIAKVQTLTRELEETRNEKDIFKKKNASSIRELRAELSLLRKSQIVVERETTSCEASELSNLQDSTNGGSSSSRASSVTSVDLTNRKNASVTSSGDDPGCFGLHQQMIEKIIKLQRQLARKQDKIDFLEEHVRQCTEELQKKTKIIQNYALREEASLLLPEGDNLSKIPSNRQVVGNSLMGSIFMNDEKAGVIHVAEVNSRLQAVLEDTLHKNITLKNNIDTLGKEISRLSRENRQLALLKLN